MIIEINGIRVELTEDKSMIFNSLAVVKFADDKKPRLQLVSSGYTASDFIKVWFLSDFTGYHEQLGKIILSKSLKRCWIESDYAKQVDFKLLRTINTSEKG